MPDTTGPRNSRKKLRILVLEDEEDLSLLIQKFLEEEGAEVFSCSSIKDATFKLASMSFDALVMDLTVSDGNSLSLLETLATHRQEKPKHSKNYLDVNSMIPIVVMSGAVDLPSIQKIKGVAASVFVKPFSISDLAMRVTTLAG